MSASPRSARRRSVAGIVAGGAAALALAGSFSPTFAAFAASITNSSNTAGTGTLTMQEASGAITCNSTDGGSVSTNAATCASINKYGGNMAMTPGQTVTTNLTIKNTGTVSATAFSLTPGACTQTNNGAANGTATDLCAKLNVVITSGGTAVWSGPASELAKKTTAPISIAAVPVAPGTSVPLTVAVTLDSSAGATYQGLAASQPLTWTFTA